MWRRLFMTALLVAGCASQPPVPVSEGKTPTVIEGSSPSRATAAEPAVAREGYYVVRKGDTLRHIAQEHGVDYRDLAAWNNMENPGKLDIGQELRVVPPEGAVVKPIENPGPLLVLDASPQAAGANSDMLKREPRGGTLAYSDKALVQVRALEGGAPPAEPGKAPEMPVKPVDRPAPVVPPPAAAAPEGSLDWTWPAAGKVLGGFAEGGGGQTSNKGVDIGGRLGEPIVAAAAGKVTYVGNLRGYGDFLVVRHNADFISVYAHASKILVKKDQTVTKGQKIAEVGSSDADQPKLHFEIRRQSKPVDPLTLLPIRP